MSTKVDTRQVSKIADEVKDLRHGEQGEKEIFSCHVTTWQGNIWKDQDLKDKKTGRKNNT